MPQQLLEMNLDSVNAVIEGYEDRMFDQQLLQVHGGFWSGYYMGAKKPKPLKVIIEKMLKQRNKPKTHHADDVDVEAYQAMEEHFKWRRKMMEGGKLDARGKRNSNS